MDIEQPLQALGSLSFIFRLLATGPPQTPDLCPYLLPSSGKPRRRHNAIPPALSQRVTHFLQHAASERKAPARRAGRADGRAPRASTPSAVEEELRHERRVSRFYE